MKCEIVIDAWLEAKENGTVASAAVQEHIKNCEDCTKKIAQFEWLNEAMLNEKKIEPPVEVRMNFEQFVEGLKSTGTRDLYTKNKSGDTNTVVRKMTAQLWLAAGLILLVGVSILLVLVFRKEPRVPQELVVNTTDSINAFASNSAFDRIEAINNANYNSAQKQELIKTLSNILLTDKNSNVRLAALYSLSDYVSDPPVFNVMLQALKTETEPALQILLITTLGEKKGLKSQEAIRSIIDNSAVQKEVRSVAEQTLKTL